jgi:hypothetical protein
MLITLDNHALVADLCAHFLRSGFTAEPVGGGMIDVHRPDAPDEDQEHREITLHLQVWLIANPNERAAPA